LKNVFEKGPNLLKLQVNLRWLIFSKIGDRHFVSGTSFLLGGNLGFGGSQRMRPLARGKFAELSRAG